MCETQYVIFLPLQKAFSFLG